MRLDRRADYAAVYAYISFLAARSRRESCMMNDWVLAAIAFALSLAAFHYASKLITRVTGRARGGMANLRSAIAFLALMVAGAAFVSSLVSSSTPLVYVAYCVVGGVASLVSQFLFGSPDGNVSESPKGAQDNPSGKGL